MKKKPEQSTWQNFVAFAHRAPLPLVSHLLLRLLLLPHDLDVPVPPVGLPQLDRPTADVLPVQLLHGPGEVRRIFETDEPEAFRLVGLFVSDDLGPLEGRVPAEGSREDFVGDVVAEVAAEKPEIVWIPFL